MTKPNTYYVHSLKRYTENEVKKMKGDKKFYRIWDCGNIIYTWKKEGSRN